MNELDADLQFIFEEITKKISFLDINLKIINNKLHFDEYHKPTNSFSYLSNKSCQPPHTKNNIALSLARHIVRIVTDVITFTRTYNPNHQFPFNKFKNCIKNTTNRELQKAFNDKKNTPYYTTTKEIKKFVSTSKI